MCNFYQHAAFENHVLPLLVCMCNVHTFLHSNDFLSHLHWAIVFIVFCFGSKLMFYLLIFVSFCEDYRNPHKSKINNYNILWVTGWEMQDHHTTAIQLLFVRERRRFTTVPNWKWNLSIRFVFGFIRFNTIAQHDKCFLVHIWTILITWNVVNQACVCVCLG